MDYFYGGVDDEKKERKYVPVSDKAKAALAAYRARLAQIKAENPNVSHQQAVEMARVNTGKPRAVRKAPKPKKSRMAPEKLARLVVRQLEHPSLKPTSSLRLKDYCGPEKKKVTLLEKRLSKLKEKMNAPKKPRAPRKPRAPSEPSAPGKPRAPRKISKVAREAAEAAVEAIQGMGYGMMF